jgi:hypothetical protein
MDSPNTQIQNLCGEAQKRGERRVFSESFQPFSAEPHKFYIYRQYTNIVFILQYNLPKKNVIWFNNKKKIMETPFGTSTVVPVRGMA